MDLTVVGLAKKLNLNNILLDAIENGQRGTSIFNLFRMAIIFDISIDELVGFGYKYSKNSAYDAHFNKIKPLILQLNNNEFNFILDILKGYIKIKNTREIK